MNASGPRELRTTQLAFDDERTLDRHGERIDRLLDEVQALAGPATWPRVEELIKALVQLYGVGLARLLAHARATTHDAPAFELQLTKDAVLAGLLTLHDLQPLPPRDAPLASGERLREPLPAKSA